MANPLGRRPNTRPGVTKMAKPLDPDLLPWEKQPDETDAMYTAFVAYRDSDRRRVNDHGPTAPTWSATWSWGHRTYEWDKHVARQEADDLVRYRVQMNERHRGIARAMMSKVAQRVINLDAETLRPAEASRWAEVAARLERDAAGMGLSLQDLASYTEPDVEPEEDRTLVDLTGMSDEDEGRIALALYQALKRD